MKLKRIDDGIKRAALYSRVSTEEQAMHGVSLEAQKERLSQYAKENGLTVVDHYVDEGVSARKRYTARPEFSRMLGDVEEGKIDVVLFIKLDRWFRNVADYYEVQAILDKHHVAWVATEEEYDTTTANGRLALNIKLAIAQDESDRTSERIKFVFQNMIKDGLAISGKTSIGFCVRNKKVEIDEKGAQIVRDMFDHYVSYRSMKATSRYILDKYGVSIDVKSMKRMLTHTWYIGEAYGIKGWCPAIIDEETFRLAGSILEVRGERYNGKRSERVYLFTGQVFCGCCGRRMSTYSCANKNKDGSIRQSFIYYRCPMRTMKQCSMEKQINQDKLEKWLIENVCDEVEIYNARMHKQLSAKPKKTIDTAKIIAKIEKLKDLYLSELLPRDIYEREYIALKSALNEAEKQKQEQQGKGKLLDSTAFVNFIRLYDTLSIDAKRAFWSKTIKKIIVSPIGTFSIEFN